MGVTIKRIAELAGVSAGTVDRALHNRGRVAPEVAQRIKQIAAELDYKPNSVAKSLSIKNKGLKISVILHIQERNVFFNDVITGIHKCEKEISDSGISVELKLCPDFNDKAQLELINEAVGQGTNAIAIVPINSPLIRQRLNELYEENFPVVLLTNKTEDTNYLSFVGCDYNMAGRITAGLLNMIAPGNHKLLLFSPSFQMLGHTRRANSLKHQLELEYPSIRLQGIYEMTGNDIEDYQLTLNALSQFPDTDLFVCPGAYGRGNLQAICESGYFGNAKIICYDYSDNIGQEIQNRNITATIIQNPQEQGYYAVRILFEYLTADKQPKKKNHFIHTRIIFKENLAELTEASE